MKHFNFDRELMSRDEFREEVFKRDNHNCVVCGLYAQDAHHIMERRLWPDGGYYMHNGASVCGPCHIRCEETNISVPRMWEYIGNPTPFVPPHLYPDQEYDKWGNPVLSDGRRLKGELFFDESVQKVLRHGGVLENFISYVKYPRTHHLPWSDSIFSDDRVTPNLVAFEGQEIVVTEKMDGENTSMYSDYFHARSIDGRGHPSRDWAKNFWAQRMGDIPQGWRVCAENLYARHSISYETLPSYVVGFSVWDDKNVCLSWDETLEWLALLNIPHVPVLYRGKWDIELLKRLAKQNRWETSEGYVVRVADQIHYGEFKAKVAKFVRLNHVQTAKHWMHGQRIEPNKLLAV